METLESVPKTNPSKSISFKMQSQVPLKKHPDPSEKYTFSIGNLMYNGLFVIEDVEFAVKLSLEGCYGRNYRAEFDIDLHDHVCKKGSVVWVLIPEELIYLSCEVNVMRVTKLSENDFYGPDELFRLLFDRSVISIKKYVIYRILRNKGFIVRDGNTYGGLFSIYKGSPEVVHSCGVIFDNNLSTLDRIAASRMFAGIRKAVIYAIFDENDQDITLTLDVINKITVELVVEKQTKGFPVSL